VNALMGMNIQVTGQQRVKAIVSLLKLDDTKRRRILQKLARKAKSASNEHRRQQQDTDGKTWDKRKKGTAKMMRKLGKYLRATANSNNATLLFNNTMVARLAYAHEKGIGDRFDIKEQKQKRDNANSVANRTAGARAEHGLNRNSTQPASKVQAKRLVDSGLFRIGKRLSKGGKTVNGGKGRIPSMRWITQNLTRGQAGAIIRDLGIALGTKTNWYIPRPRRGWLGLTFEETQQMSDFIIDELAQQF
jgi:hypothetical protein